MNRLRFPLEFPVVTLCVLAVAIAMFGPSYVPIIGQFFPLTWVLAAEILVLWIAAAARGDGRFKAVVMAGVAGGATSALIAWLVAMLTLQITSRVETKAEFGDSMNATRDLIYYGCLFFALMGGAIGTVFMWYWMEPKSADDAKKADGPKKANS